MDRLFWVGLARAWTGWRQTLVIVSPDTVLRWRRRRFREHWAQLSGRSTRGRPCINAEIAALVRKMAAANPLWGAPRIHGELLKLGIDVAERTVSRLMPKRRPQPSQTWRTFLANHIPTWSRSTSSPCPPPASASVRPRVLAHHRRRVLRFKSPRIHRRLDAQQLVDAFLDDSAPAYLLRDRDHLYGQQFRHA